jgi:hypothetical protein
MMGFACTSISLWFHILRRKPRLAEELFVSEEGLYSMELFISGHWKEVLQIVPPHLHRILAPPKKA